MLGLQVILRSILVAKRIEGRCQRPVGLEHPLPPLILAPYASRAARERAAKQSVEVRTPIMWFELMRKTGESGSSDEGAEPIWISADAIQFFQAGGRGTRVFLRAGGLESIDVTETLDEIKGKIAAAR